MLLAGAAIAVFEYAYPCALGPAECFGPARSAKLSLGLVADMDVMVVKAVFAAFAERDVERVLELIDPEVEFTPVTNDFAGRTEPYRGHEGIREYLRDVSLVWDDLRLTPSEYRKVGGNVLVIGRVSARSAARIVDGSTGWIWRVRDGRVVYGRVYASAGDAEAAATEED
jgi:ketosteroid isomerase-like protein